MSINVVVSSFSGNVVSTLSLYLDSSIAEIYEEIAAFWERETERDGSTVTITESRIPEDCEHCLVYNGEILDKSKILGDYVESDEDGYLPLEITLYEVFVSQCVSSTVFAHTYFF